LPDDFNLTVNALTCGCETKSDMLLRCQPQALFAALAKINVLPVMNELIDLILIDTSYKNRHVVSHQAQCSG